MNKTKTKKSFSYRDLLYKVLIFIGTVAIIVYFLPRDGKFNYQFDIDKPWKYGQLMATFDFPIYKDDAVVKREQDSILAAFQPYYQLDKSIEKTATPLNCALNALILALNDSAAALVALLSKKLIISR